ncbi:MAG: family 43 glycosylhydrolase [Verrucomicrobiota bacterium]
MKQVSSILNLLRVRWLQVSREGRWTVAERIFQLPSVELKDTPSGLSNFMKPTLALLTALLLAPLAALHAAQFYVATNGVNTNPGTLERPFRTIQKAASITGPGDTVLIRAGTYREPVAPSRSGEAGRPITFRNYEGEEVTLSGAEIVPADAWSRGSNKLFQAAVPMPLGNDNQLFFNGQMMIEARFPNASLDVSRPAKLAAQSGSCVGTRDKAIGTITNAALNQPPGYWTGASLHIALGKVWIFETLKVAASGPGWIQFPFHEGTDYQPREGNPFHLTGKLSELDAPGEWFYDPASRRLHFHPPADADPAQHRVEFKARQFAFDLRGRSHIALSGLKLFAATIVMDKDSGHLDLNGLDCRYLSHFSELVRWKTGLTNSGIILNGQSNVLRNSLLAYSAGNGVALIGVGHTISNNVIHDIDYTGGIGAGINTGGGCRGAVISHNTIYDVGHRMIDMGKLRAGLLEYNDLSHGGLQVTDFGGVYAASTDGENTRICYNRIHDTDGPSSGLARPNNSKGIYLDNGSSNYIVDHNVTWNVDRALVLNSREGKGETNRNNLILNNTLSGTSWSYGWKHCPSPETVVANNIFLARAEPGVGATVKSNLFPGTDPRFVPGSRFELRADSPARRAGVVRAPYALGTAGQPPDLGAFPYGVKPWTAGSTSWDANKRTAQNPSPSKDRMMYADTTRRGKPWSKNPFVLRLGGRYLMYSSILPVPGSDARESEITESRDLIHWKNVGVIRVQEPYERNGISAPCGLVKDGQVHLFYQTYGNGTNDAICHAVSDDGITGFKRNPSNPIFRPDGAWNCGRAIDAEVFFHDGKYLMYYATRDPGYKVQMQGVAAAPANTTFSRNEWTHLSKDGPILKPELPWEGECIEAASIIRRNGQLYMFYAGSYDNTPQQIGVATSKDGVKWTRLFNEPFLRNGRPGEWNSSESGHPGIFDDGARSFLFFQGNPDKGNTWWLSNVEVFWNAKGPFLESGQSSPRNP